MIPSWTLLFYFFKKKSFIKTIFHFHSFLFDLLNSCWQDLLSHHSPTGRGSPASLQSAVHSQRKLAILGNFVRLPYREITQEKYKNKNLSVGGAMLGGRPQAAKDHCCPSMPQACGLTSAVVMTHGGLAVPIFLLFLQPPGIIGSYRPLRLL